MTTRSVRIKEVFVAAMDLPPGPERDALLDRECAGDAELRLRVESLLAAHAAPLPALEQPLAPQGGASLDAFEEQAGNVLAGRYKLLERIGEGGMGAVWVAEQLHPVRRKVAIKLVKAGMDSKTVLARFDAERQALALMDHPNIAKVFDGGVTDRGRPFFAMEYVRGVPITQYCDGARLSVAERLALFVSVCQAVQHAHQKGIIHRDLKPSNVLVCLYDGRPEPKVIDFGLAKAVYQPLTDKTIHTMHGLMVGTPLYMSPEQAEFTNLDVDTRTDVYALGVILYELLTGTTPLENDRLQAVAWQEILRLIKEEDPQRPSDRVSGSQSLPSVAAMRHSEPRSLPGLVRGDLDWIVMRCLEKDRVRRYATANDLAQDIGHHLRDEPVDACPPSAAYRMRKWVLRNKAVAVGSTAVALALIGGAVGTTLGLVRARRAEAIVRADRDRAESNFRDARAAVDDYLTAVSETELFDASGMQPLRKQLLERALHYYERFLEQRGGDTSVRRELAASHYRVGWIAGTTSDPERAREQYGKALEIYDELIREAPDVERYRIDRAMVFNDLGSALSVLGRYGEAIAAHESARAAREVLAAAHKGEGRYQNELGKSYVNLGIALNGNGAPREALEALRKGVALDEVALRTPAADLASFPTDLGRNFSRPSAIRLDIAAARERVASTLFVLGRNDEAMEEDKIARVELEALVRDDPASVGARWQLVRCLRQLSFRQGESAEADESLRRAREVVEPLANENPALAGVQSLRATVAQELARHMRLRGEVEQARNELERAIAILKSLPSAERTGYHVEGMLAACHRELARVERACERPVEALKHVMLARDLDESMSASYVGLNYNLACDYACAVDLVGWRKADDALSEAERAERARLGDEAMRALRRAIENGWRNVDHFAKDEDLDALRGRDDFRVLMAELASNAAPAGR